MSTAASTTTSTRKSKINVNNGIHVIRDSSLFVSEPNPLWFGNAPNPVRGNKANKNYSETSANDSVGDAAVQNESSANWTNDNWLKSRFHFNFAEFSHGDSNFGPLRVCNDDLVQPKRGFGEHPHANAEIVTYVVDGFLTHQDSMKLQNRTQSSSPTSSFAETLTSGDVQFMTAGTGVRHSEHNLSDKPLRFIQMWFMPRQRGLKPNYGSRKGGDPIHRRNKWQHLVTDIRNNNTKNDDDDAAADNNNDDDDSSNVVIRDEPININQDVEIFVTDMTPNQTLSYSVEEGRQVYLLCLKGRDLSLQDGVLVHQHDAAKVQQGVDLALQTGEESGASVLLIDVSKRF